MKNKKLFNLFAIILGVIMCFGFVNVQAAEITSVFTSQTISRSNIQTLGSNLLSNPITLQRLDSGYKYDGGTKVIWKFIDKDNPNDMYYCLNKDQGFAYSTEAEYNYISNLNLEDLKSFSDSNTITWNNAKYNKVLWVLDNVYIPNETVDIYEDDACIDLLERAGISTEKYSDTYDLVVEDIITAQRMAIWNITNGLSAINDISGVPDQDLEDYYTGDTLAFSRKSKIIKLYNYLVNNASESYTKGEPTIRVEDEAVIVETDENYIVGPYSMVGDNLEKIQKIEVTASHNYTLLNSSKNEVANNNFKKVLGKDFYLQIPKSEINETTDISLNLTYTYDYRTFTFMTNSLEYLDTQPVVIVKSEERGKDLEIVTQIPLVDISVEKVWEDNNNQDDVRPNSIKVQLYKTKNGTEMSMGDKYKVTLNAKNNWKYTWTKLLKGYTYTVKELNETNEKVENNEKYNGYYIATYLVEDNKTTITNTHEPEKLSKTVTKIWDDNNNQDGIRPESVKVALYKTVDNVKQKVEEVELNESNEWKYTWNDLNKFENGVEIKYAVEEYIPDNYTVSYSEDTFTITNKYTPGTVSKTVIKEWFDQENIDGIRPANVTVQLYANGKEYGKEVLLNEENGFTYTWTNLPEKENGTVIDYTISEIKIGRELVENNAAAGYSVTYDVEGNIVTVINVHEPEKTSKTVNKIWVDNNNKDNTRPENIKVQLYANGEVYGEAITLTSGEDKIWQEEELTYTWSELPLNENGQEIIYTAKELDTNNEAIENGEKYDNRYVVSYSEDTFTITNTSKVFDLSLRKFITKVNDIEYAREPIVDTSTIATTGTAIYKHIKQPIPVQKGDIVTYTIRVYNEGEVDGYVDMITDYLPDNLLPIIDGIEGIDKERYAEEIEFNSNWLWMYFDDGKKLTTTITSKSNSDSETYSVLTGLDEVTDTKLNAYVEGSDKLDYIDVQIKCLVSENSVSNEYLTNIAEITRMCDVNGIEIETDRDSTKENVDYSNLADYKNNEAINSTTSSYIEGQEDDDDFEKIVIKEFDLSLRKFITKVNETSYSRVPTVDTSKLGTIFDGKVITTAAYNHSKEPVIVETNDLVTYTIRIYNEGTLAGYVNEITDNLPEGLEFMPDSSVNVSYRWKMIDEEGNVTEDVSKAVKIVTDYLSDIDKNNIIDAVSEEDGVKTLSYKDVEVQFKVVAKAKKLQDNLIINEAQISQDSDRDIDSTPNRDEKYNYVSGNNEDDIDYEPIKLKYFDLSLRKFITKVNTTEYNNRYPEIKYNDDGSITYTHTKDPVLVTTNDIVVYTIRIYNEGEKAGYATQITDNLPEGLEFIPDNEINKQYGWKIIDSEGNVTEDVSKAAKFNTDYLKDELIDALVIKNGSKILSYKDVQIAFKVTESMMSDRILVNIAEIYNDSDEDVDSTPGNSELTEDDIDREYVKVQYFDLSLKKWVTKTQVTYNGKTTTTKTGFTEDTDEIAKVDLVASKMKKTTVKFTYNIKVTNEGELPGYVYEVKDYIPNGLKFVAEDNKDWKEVKDGIIVTEKLKDTLLNPGESATVEVVLTWKNSTTNTGLKTNYAEISKDSADDIDSTPDNYNKKEDDIDDAQVILSIKTAGPQTYIGLVFATIAILAGGIFLIKKYVIE